MVFLRPVSTLHSSDPPELSRDLPRIDVHIHLAGVGTGGSGCWISPRFRARPAFLGMQFIHGIRTADLRRSIDQDWPAYISALIADSDLDFGVALGFDGVYDSAGRFDPRRSQLVIPPSWVFAACERYANLLPGPSINPDRDDAFDLLEESIERGAVLIKWLPIVQGFDPASRRSLRFLERLASAGIPLLVHAGSGEVTFHKVDADIGSLDRLVPALEAGVKVICAHSAARIHGSRDRDEVPLLRSLIERYPNLWADDSGLTNPSRWMHLPRLARDPAIMERTVHGSDFPVPIGAIYYLRQLGIREVRRLYGIRNPLQREIEIKRAFGIADSSLRRAASVLANLDRWHRPAADNRVTAFT